MRFIVGSTQFDDASRREEGEAKWRRAAVESSYCPRAWLAEWFERIPGAPASVWLFVSTGVQPLRAAYRHVIEEVSTDTAIPDHGVIPL